VRQRVSFVKGDMRDWPARAMLRCRSHACCSVSHLLTLDDRRPHLGDRVSLAPSRLRSLFSMSACLTWLRWPKSHAYDHAAFVDLESMPLAGAWGKRARLLRCTATTYKLTCSEPTYA